MGAVAEYKRGWEWPEWNTFGPRPTTRRESIGGVIGPSVFLFFLIQPLSQVLQAHEAAWWKAVVLAIIAGYSVAYVIAIARCQNGLGSRWARVGVVGSLALFAVLLAAFLGFDALVFSTYVISTALMVLPRNAGLLIGSAFGVTLAVGTRLTDGQVNWGSTWVLAVLTIAIFAFTGLISTIRQLKEAQVKMAKLAVAEERSRLARDLHDVLGHSLTTITVKAGLARRVLESAADRERAIAEVRDVEELARQAMTEVRATVSGYRTPSLAAELVGARAALQAAGIAADLPQAVDDVPADLREAFAYVIREGVTNVVRHSGATRCEVRLGERWAEVRDNGRACGEAVTNSRASGGGHGLSGLAERVSAVDGELDAGPLPEGGFLLRVSVKRTGPKPPERSETPIVGLSASAQPWAGIA